MDISSLCKAENIHKIPGRRYVKNIDWVRCNAFFKLVCNHNFLKEGLDEVENAVFKFRTDYIEFLY